MKKIIYIFFTLLQVLLGVGAYLIQDYSMKRMGMMRHVVVQNIKWEMEYSMSTIETSVVLAFGIIALLIIFIEIRKKHSPLDKGNLYRVIETIAISAGIIAFIFLNTTDTYRSYYFISICLILIMCLQYFKFLLYFIKRQKK